MANRQEIVCTYIYENYVQFDRLRHDVSPVAGYHDGGCE